MRFTQVPLRFSLSAVCWDEVRRDVRVFDSGQFCANSDIRLRKFQVKVSPKVKTKTFCRRCNKKNTLADGASAREIVAGYVAARTRYANWRMAKIESRRLGTDSFWIAVWNVIFGQGHRWLSHLVGTESRASDPASGRRWRTAKYPFFINAMMISTAPKVHTMVAPVGKSAQTET